jgi:hypothetical protein
LMGTHWIYHLTNRKKIGATRVLKRRLRQQKYGMPKDDARVEILAVYTGLADQAIAEREAAWAKSYGCDIGSHTT